MKTSWRDHTIWASNRPRKKNIEPKSNFASVISGIPSLADPLEQSSTVSSIGLSSFIPCFNVIFFMPWTMLVITDGRTGAETTNGQHIIDNLAPCYFMIEWWNCQFIILWNRAWFDDCLVDSALQGRCILSTTQPRWCDWTLGVSGGEIVRKKTLRRRLRK